MKLTVDTNILIRAFVDDDPRQGLLAQEALRQADGVVLITIVLCELVWVLTQTYGFRRPDIAAAIRRLTTTANVEMDRPAVEAGLAMMDAGGDFADGVIAYEGRALGGEVFASFDRKAVKLLEGQGLATRLLA